MKKNFLKLPVLLFIVFHRLLFADENIELLHIEPAVIDFGKVSENNSPLNLNFKVTNSSDESVEITDTQTGCGCTVAKLSKSFVLPDETISVSVKIKNIPLDQSTNSWHLTLLPTDKKIKPLVIPTACYRSVPKEEALKKILLIDKKTDTPTKKTQPILKPERIGLGVVPLGEERTFEVLGLSELLPSLTVKNLSGFPEGTTVKLNPDNVEKDKRTVKIHIGKSVKSGFVKGTIYWQCSNNVEFSTEVLAIIAPAIQQQEK
ncbi:MAG: DUF1573 domain-containing protein [Planctomycetaceae bacterium]|jgi:hypothetical protein|nr:DUF1573 domain-containing protein [Planctomycetaceae bacterium]